MYLERRREREKHLSAASHTLPDQGSNLQPWYMPWLGSNMHLLMAQHDAPTNCITCSGHHFVFKAVNQRTIAPEAPKALGKTADSSWTRLAESESLGVKQRIYIFNQLSTCCCLYSDVWGHCLWEPQPTLFSMICELESSYHCKELISAQLKAYPQTFHYWFTKS